MAFTIAHLQSGRNPMRAFLLFPLAVLAGCASTSAKDLEKMSTIDVCYFAMMEPDQKAMAKAEIRRRNANCDQYSAELKKMADQEMRAGGSGPSTSDAAKAGAGTMGGGTGGMGRY